MTGFTKIVPAVALRAITILPGTVAHFDISRERSIKAVEQAMLADEIVFLVTQVDAQEEEPTASGLYTTGILAKIKQVVKLQNHLVRVLVEGLEAARVEHIATDDEYNCAEVMTVQRIPLEPNEEEAFLRMICEQAIAAAERAGKKREDAEKQYKTVQDPEKLIYQAANAFLPEYTTKQSILDAVTVRDAAMVLLRELTKEAEIESIRREVANKVREKLDENQRKYVLSEQMKILREELGEDDGEAEFDQYAEAVEELQADESVKQKLRKEISRLRTLSTGSSESAVARGYIETLLELPWDKTSQDNNDLAHARAILDEDHYGLEKVKERMLEFLAVRTLTQKGETPIICLVGPPGTGKTSIATSVARALDKKYIRVCLGGVRDEAEIRGHRRTYVGAMPGRIATGLKNAGVKNPLMLLDEIDKVSNDYKGDVFSALLEVLDSEQNNRFSDHYVELPIDLSEVLFIATANSTSTIPRPLLDRMEIIEVSSYTENEKVHIAKDHLIRKQIAKNGLSAKQLSIRKNALDQIIRGYTKEAGVRNLERRIGDICRKAAREILEEGAEKIVVTDKNLEKYLGKRKYNYLTANRKPEIGIVRGLAWTSVGGDTLQIEVNIMPGKGALKLTGQLGDVMKESAQAGISYVRSISEGYGVSKEFFAENDIHVHIPEGAVPKDGPSAGITMATAMFSAITGKPVRADVAMTGEITLRGRVLPIGGLKEKTLAAKNAKMKTVIVPKDNRPDIEELSNEITDGLEILFVESMDEVLKIALA